MTSNAPESPSPSAASGEGGQSGGQGGMDDYPGTSPDEGRLEAEEMDGDSDGGDSRQQS